eukprot:3339404-Rhodomonas_salina.1
MGRTTATTPSIWLHPSALVCPAKEPAPRLTATPLFPVRARRSTAPYPKSAPETLPVAQAQRVELRVQQLLHLPRPLKALLAMRACPLSATAPRIVIHPSVVAHDCTPIVNPLDDLAPKRLQLPHDWLEQ